MIHLCSCTGGSASAIGSFNYQEGLKSCRSCGGKLAVDGRVALSGNMMSTVGLELSGVIDPQLNWKTATKGRQRAVRRARTSFTGGNQHKSTTKTLNRSEDATDKESKRAGDIPVSESEKLGVSILGRRFSDVVESVSVPIKKRRFMLTHPRSPSPPPQSSSHSNDPDRIIERPSASYQETALSVKWHQEWSTAGDKTGLKDINEELCDTADFSGISILAAAACDSGIVGEMMNAGGSRKVESNSLLEEKKEQILCNSEDLHGKSDPLETSSTLMLPSAVSDGTKCDVSHNLEKSTGMLRKVPDKTKRVKSSSRDSRLHWDLNTVMDAWDSNCDEVVNSEAVAVDGGNGSYNEIHEKVDTFQAQVEYRDTKHSPVVGDCSVQVGRVSHDTEAQGQPIIASVHSVADCNEGRECCSLLYGNVLTQEKNQLEEASIAMVVSAEEIKPLHDQEKCDTIAEVVSSPVGSGLDSAIGPSISAAYMGKEKDDTSIRLVAEAETSSSHLVVSENVTTGHATDSCPKVDQSICKLVFQESMNPTSVADVDVRSTDHCVTDCKMGQASHIGSPQTEKHVCSSDSGSRNADQCLSGSHLPGQASELHADANTCTTVMIAGGMSAELVDSHGVGETENDDHVDKSRESDVSPHLSNSHPYDQSSLANFSELSFGNASAGECGTAVVDMKLNDNKSSVLNENKSSALPDVNLGATKTDCSVQDGSKASVCNSVGTLSETVGAPHLDGAFSSDAGGKSYGDCYADRPGETALNKSGYDSDASQVDIDQANGMEKVDLLGDDDSQYEDGEFRESLLNSWGEDGAEEVETERVDYGSDNRENDIFVAASDFSASAFWPAGSLSRKNGGLSDSSHDGAQAGKTDIQDFGCPPLLKCSSVTDILDDGSGKSSIGSVVRKDQRSHLRVRDWSGRSDGKDGMECGSGSDKVTEDIDFFEKGEAAREFSHSANFRMKSSGWDRLPESCRSSGDGLADSGVESLNRSHIAAHLDAACKGESLRRLGSSSRRDLSSGLERSNSSDGSHRKDRSYGRASRSDGHDGPNLKADKDTVTPRSVGKGGSSRHTPGRGRGEHWGDLSNRCGPTRHGSPGYYGAPSFAPPGSRNAAAAAVAKVESNGFVVAPDGTIVKAGGGGRNGRLPRRSGNASLQSTHRSLSGRSSPIDRDGGRSFQRGLGNSRNLSPDRSVGFGRGRTNRYGPDRCRRAMPDERLDSSLPMHHSLSRRERSFSPQRGSLRLSRSRTRSPSRSRTRSPHIWTSPRGRSDIGINGGADLRRRSRSPPSFKPEVRMERMRSPHWRSGFEDHIVGYAPPSRIHTSPSHASRWVGGRKNSPDLREHEYKRCTGRSSSARVLSRSDRFDLMDSPGRMKPDDYYRPTQSTRFPGFVDFGRGSRHDGHGEGVGQRDRYDMLHSAKQPNVDGKVRRFRYDVEDGFRNHNPRTKSSEIHRRGSPRSFERGVESQLGDSPGSAKEDKGPFRYGRSGRHGASFKSYGVRDCDDGMTTRRRPS